MTEPAARARLIEGQNVFAGAGNLKEIKFFANNFDTRTRGLDLVLTWSYGARDCEIEPVRIAANLSSQRMSAHFMCYTSTGTARAGLDRRRASTSPLRPTAEVHA